MGPRRNSESATAVLGASFPKPTTLAVEIARHLREAIIHGRIRPGERLNESNLTHVFALSRTPIREGLRILEAEGLVTLEPRRGAYVRTLSPTELREIFEVRLMFETHAILQGGPAITEAQLKSMRQSLEEARTALRDKAYEPWHQASLRFHDGIVALAGNTHLQRLYEELKMSLRRYQISLIQIPKQPTQSQTDHESILEALERRDIGAAVETLRRHVGSLEATLRRRLRAEHARDAGEVGQSEKEPASGGSPWSRPSRGQSNR